VLPAAQEWNDRDGQHKEHNVPVMPRLVMLSAAALLCDAVPLLCDAILLLYATVGRETHARMKALYWFSERHGSCTSRRSGPLIGYGQANTFPSGQED
jgi:hypothetical protein